MAVALAYWPPPRCTHSPHSRSPRTSPKVAKSARNFLDPVAQATAVVVVAMMPRSLPPRGAAHRSTQVDHEQVLAAATAVARLVAMAVRRNRRHPAVEWRQVCRAAVFAAPASAFLPWSLLVTRVGGWQAVVGRETFLLLEAVQPVAPPFETPLLTTQLLVVLLGLFQRPG